MAEFDNGVGHGEGGKEPEKLPQGPCVSTKTPAGFNVNALRASLQAWTSNDPTMTISDFVQTDGSGCFPRANQRIPKKWGVPATIVKYRDPYPAFVDDVIPKLSTKESNKPRLCTYQYWKGDPIQGPLSTFGMHWIVIIGAGKATNGRKFLVVFDPDGDATARSKKKWDPCRQLQFDVAPVAANVIESLVLGEGNKLGGLIRYFYP